MGMFDYLRCDLPLPDGHSSLTFQTKSLFCQMEYYAITAEGRLIDTKPTTDQEWDGDIHFGVNEPNVNYRATFRRGQCREIFSWKTGDGWVHVWPGWPEAPIPQYPGRWRVGRKVPLNVYAGDRPICQCHNANDARRIVDAVNATWERELEKGSSR